MVDLIEMLRLRACQAGEPWTGNDPKSDHGHTDCWLQHQAADEIERLRTLITAWADAEDARDQLWKRGQTRTQQEVHDAEHRVDHALDALRKAIGR